MRLNLSCLSAVLLLTACTDDPNSDSPDATVAVDVDVTDVDAAVDVEDAEADAVLDAETDLAIDADTGTPVDPSLEAYCGADFAEVEARIDAALAELTLAEKAALMHGETALPLTGAWTTPGVERLGVPGFRMLDGPRGLSRFAGTEGTAFPVPMARGATWDPELEERVGRAIGAELRVVGADVLLAPTVNVLRHPRWGRAQETYGEDPYLLGVLGGAFVRGAQDHVMAVVKHYAVNSIEDTRLEVDVTVDEQTLREVYLPHFRTIVQDAQVAGVMTAYNAVNGDWASESAPLVRDILREEWGFHGFTVSDFVWGTHDTAPALEAGLDVEMPAGVIYGSPVVEGVESGAFDEAVIDAAVRRILRAQWCFVESTVEPDVTETESDAALELARLVAVRGAVLLENRDDALPILREDTARVAVVGRLADEENTGDRGSSHVRSSDIVTVREGMEALADAVAIDAVPADTEDFDERVGTADVVVAVVGYTDADEGEGQVAAGDRRSLALPDEDIALVQQLTALHDRVVVVVIGGSAIITDGWGMESEAIVMAWYPGARGGEAIASLLFGDENFAGRLPVSFAASEADLPPFDNVSTSVTYGPLHGYRLLAETGAVPLYPFGYGLSYTEFAYDGVEASVEGDVLRVSLRVRNVGERAGIATPQVYVSGPDADAPPLDLRGFSRVSLAPDESTEVQIDVPLSELRVWRDGSWTRVPGEYVVSVGVDALSHVGSVEIAIP